MAAGFEGADGSERNDISVVTRSFQQVGGSFGTAVIAVVLTAGATMTIGFRYSFWWATGLAVAGGVLALLLPGRASVPAPTVRHEGVRA